SRKACSECDRSRSDDSRNDVISSAIAKSVTVRVNSFHRFARSVGLERSVRSFDTTATAATVAQMSAPRRELHQAAAASGNMYTKLKRKSSGAVSRSTVQMVAMTRIASVAAIND